MQYKGVLGFASVAVAIVGYIPYLRDIFRYKTKPHAFSWLVWASLSGIAFGIQITNNGGPGAWLMGFTSLITFIIFVLSIKYGEKNIVIYDWLSLMFAAVALLLWLVTNNPLASVILISLIDLIGGFVPTFRKSFHKPQEETTELYLLYAVSLVLSLIALENPSLINVLYPATFVGVNLSMVVFLKIRRKQLST